MKSQIEDAMGTRKEYVSIEYENTTGTRLAHD